MTGKIYVPLKNLEKESLVKIDKILNKAKEAITLYEPLKNIKNIIYYPFNY